MLAKMKGKEDLEWRKEPGIHAVAGNYEGACADARWYTPRTGVNTSTQAASGDIGTFKTHIMLGTRMSATESFLIIGFEICQLLVSVTGKLE